MADTSYVLKFSDPTKQADSIVVLGTSVGPGKNNYDTSLDLVGPGYLNYGQATAQNFLKLLENFASPLPPTNSIEGQLWYDTSNPTRKVLRINNGSLSSSRWPSANGIYQESTDPVTQYGNNVKEGDIWVDIGNNQLKIRYGTEWTTVGPSVAVSEEKSGSETALIASNSGETFPVILNWVNGKVVEIIAYNEFTPRSIIDGFSTLKPGANLTIRNNAKFNGLADRAASLEITKGVTIPASGVLRNTWPSTSRQVHTGTLVIESVNGFSVKRNNVSSQELKLLISDTGALINFNTSTSNLKVGIENSAYISFNGQYGKVGINTTASILNASSATLSINGGAAFLNTVTITLNTSSNTGLELRGGIKSIGSLSITGNSVLGGFTTVTNTLTVANVYASTSTNQIGTEAVPFERIFVKNIGTGSIVTNINGIVTKAVQLETARQFKIEGVITSTQVSFNGTASVILTATTNASLITGTTYTTATTATQTLLVVNTGTSPQVLNQISKADFLADIYSSIFVTGMMTPFGSNDPTKVPPGWLLCQGQRLPTTGTGSNLFSVIQLTYTSATTSVGYYQVPDLTTATFVTTGTSVGAYVPYIIKL